MNPLTLVVTCVAGWLNRHQQVVIEYLQEEVHVLQDQLGRRSRFNGDQRRRLALKAKTVGRQGLRHFARIVTPDTLLAWHRRLIAQKSDSSLVRKPGRPRTVGNLQALILRLARESRSWGCTRIQGALLNLGQGEGERQSILPFAARSVVPPRKAGNPVLFLLTLVFGIWCGCKPSASSAPVPAHPNLIVILADDMGYSDPGCFGGEISTPALDRLAREGVRLTRFQNGGMCVVSRASMLTGQWWPRALKHFERTPLLPEQLHSAGYRTALIGKWHLDGHPLDRGFDHFFGFLGGFSDHFAGGKDYRLDRAPFKDFGTNYYSTDAFTDRAIHFIKGNTSGGSNQPFFLYLSFQAPHNPLQAPPEDIAKYRGKYLNGWQAVREARFKRQKELGIVPPDATLPAYPKNLPDWNSLTPEQRDLEDLRMAVFAAMIERMDRGIGRLLEALNQSGQAENTLILFLSDNGADSFSVMDQVMLKQGRLPGDPNSNWQLGTGWAYASVTPWRLYKISQHAGGITTGAIAWWPGALGQPGRIESSPVHMVDVLPTFLDLAGRTNASKAVAGESFLPLLHGQSWQRKGPLFFQYMDNRAIRTHHWTLAEVDGAGWELFREDSDQLETQNLAANNPEVVADLDARWLKWWCAEGRHANYQPESTRSGPHYKPQGDRGSGVPYKPSAMPESLSGRYPFH